MLFQKHVMHTKFNTYILLQYQANPVYTLSLNIHLFNFPLSNCCSCIMLHTAYIPFLDVPLLLRCIYFAVDLCFSKAMISSERCRLLSPYRMIIASLLFFLGILCLFNCVFMLWYCRTLPTKNSLLGWFQKRKQQMAPVEETADWACSICTLINKGSEVSCKACQTKKNSVGQECQEQESKFLGHHVMQQVTTYTAF